MNTAFELIEERMIAEQKHTRARLWRHKKTGAEILSCCNTDENKVFGVVFRTPPTDSTGVPHILEHSVLCGSKKYPVKEPFVELLKSSLQTFLNAFTYPDKTCYPVASTNVQDFYNLMDVYLDAVFYPTITEDIFKQEGWHVEATSVEEPLSFKGVVYNEMKGVYSSADSLLAEKTQHSLFPDTTYSVDSGGEPTSILELTYEQFIDFHTQLYHPSNARFYFWGDDDEAIRLEKLATVLDAFTKTTPDSAIALQAPFTVSKHVEYSYESAKIEKSTLVTCNWLLPETTDARCNFAFEILDYVLMGMPGSPLRRALIESGIGTDITGGGIHSDLRQMYFSVGLKGIDGSRVQEVESCIFETLATLVEEGISAELLEAAFTSIEFVLRENNTSRFPVGLALMVRSLTTWLYDASPFTLLEFEKPLAWLREQPNTYFTDMIRTYFLENTSRTTVVLVPDTTMAERRVQEEKAQLEKIEKELSKEQKAQLVEDTKIFLAKQAVADSEEDLARIPKLRVEDLPISTKDTPVVTSGVCYTSALETSGIAYMDLYLSMERVPSVLFPMLPLFARAMTEMGTTKRDYIDLGIAISCSAGDIELIPSFYTECDTNAVKMMFLVETKSIYSKAKEVEALLLEILMCPNFSDKERFLQILLEEKARAEQSIAPAGHTTALTRLSAQYTNIGVVEEHTGGIEYLGFLRRLEVRIATEWDAVVAELHLLHSAICTNSGGIANIICEETHIPLYAKQVDTIFAQLPTPSTEIQEYSATRFLLRNEAIITQSQVNYMAKGYNFIDAGFAYNGSFAVACKYLRMGYLWEKVRVQGGAYGAFVLLNRVTGLLALASYRDPSTKETIAVFNNAGTHLKKHTFSQSDINSLIVATIGDIDSYLLPDAKGRLAFSHCITKNTVERRQQQRDEILSTTAKTIASFSDVLDALAEQGTVVGVGGEALSSTATEERYEKIMVDSYE